MESSFLIYRENCIIKELYNYIIHYLIIYSILSRLKKLFSILSQSISKRIVTQILLHAWQSLHHGKISKFSIYMLFILNLWLITVQKSTYENNINYI